MATLTANISGQEHDIDNRETVLGTTHGPYISQNFMNFGTLTSKTGPKFSPTLRNHHLLGGSGIMLAALRRDNMSSLNIKFNVFLWLLRLVITLDTDLYHLQVFT